MFRYILNECLNGKFPCFKETLNQIFFDTKSLVTKEKKCFQIDKNYYNLIVYLSNNQSDFFKKTIKPDKTYYKKMAEWMTESVAINAFDGSFTKHFC